MKKIIYFLCTGNSCRSQMAEGFAKKYSGDEWDVFSAGIEAHGMNPQAVRVMKEVGIDISTQKSEMIDFELLQQATIVITLCGDAQDKCPTLPPTVTCYHWGVNDPAKAQGTAEQKWLVFQEVRDTIEKKLIEFFNNI
ncbi:MAG: arsenate reductase (thioredoxin) [Kurthia sp.]|nr:arsenate reductase (thioredoxin) [Candidatus Kurthia equi]